MQFLQFVIRFHGFCVRNRLKLVVAVIQCVMFIVWPLGGAQRVAIILNTSPPKCQHLVTANTRTLRYISSQLGLIVISRYRFPISRQPYVRLRYTK